MTAAKLPPGPRGLPFVGSLFSYLRDPTGFLLRCARDYGDVVLLRVAAARIYLLNNPVDIEYVLRTHAKDFIKDRWTRHLTSLVGTGLLTSEGEVWRRSRQMAAPAFQLQQIAGYGQIMVDRTRRLLSDWKDGQIRDLHAEMMRLTLSIVAQALFSTDVESVAQQVGSAIEIASQHFVSPVQLPASLQWLPLPGQIRYRKAVERLDDIIYGMIRHRRDRPEGQDDLLARLLAARDEQGQPMTDRQLRDELITLVLAGHETTALTLTYCFYLLGHDPRARSRLEAEVDEVLGGRRPTAQDLPRLVYAERVVKESLRLYPPAWSLGREAIVDCTVGGYPVPKGTQLMIAQWVVHRDPRWFTDPEEFRPERWEDELARRLPRDAYFPFGDGPRICIGNHFAMLEAVLLLATIVQQFRLELVAGQTLELVPSVTIRPKGPVNATLHRRSDNEPKA